MVWHLIKKFMKDTESINNVRFEDSAWQLAKQLETDILAAHRKEWNELVESSDALHDEQDTRIRQLEASLRAIKEHTRLTSDEATLAIAIKRLLRIWDEVEKVLDAEGKKESSK